MNDSLKTQHMSWNHMFKKKRKEKKLTMDETIVLRPGPIQDPGSKFWSGH